MFFAGGGIQRGTVTGPTDAIAAYPTSAPQSPADTAATIYHTLGLPSTATRQDDLTRPHSIYHGQAIAGLV